MSAFSGDEWYSITQGPLNFTEQHSWKSGSDTKVHREYYYFHQSSCDYDAVYIRRSFEMEEYRPGCTQESYASNEFLRSTNCLAMLGCVDMHKNHNGIGVVKLDCSRLSDTPSQQQEEQTKNKCFASNFESSQLEAIPIGFTCEDLSILSDNKHATLSAHVESVDDILEKKVHIATESTIPTNSPLTSFRRAHSKPLAIAYMSEVDFDKCNLVAGLFDSTDSTPDVISDSDDYTHEIGNDRYENTQVIVVEEVNSATEDDVDGCSEYAIYSDEKSNKDEDEKQMSSNMELSFISNNLSSNYSISECNDDVACANACLKQHGEDNSLDISAGKVTVELGALEPNVLQKMTVSSKKALTREFLRQQTMHDFDSSYVHLVHSQQVDDSSCSLSHQNIFQPPSAPTLEGYYTGVKYNNALLRGGVSIDALRDRKCDLGISAKNNIRSACTDGGRPEDSDSLDASRDLESENTMDTVKKFYNTSDLNKLKNSHLINRVVTINPQRDKALKKEKQQSYGNSIQKGGKSNKSKDAKVGKNADTCPSTSVHTKKAAVTNPLLHEHRHSIDLRKDMMYKKFLEAFKVKKNGKLLQHLRIPTKKVKPQNESPAYAKHVKNMTISTPTSTSNTLAIYAKDKNDSDEYGYNDGNNTTELCSASGAGGDSSTTLMDLPSSDAMDETDFVNIRPQQIAIIKDENNDIYLKKQQQRQQKLDLEHKNSEGFDLAQRFMDNIMGRYSANHDFTTKRLIQRDMFYSRFLCNGHDMSRSAHKRSDSPDPIVCLSASGCENSGFYFDDGDHLKRYNTVKSNGKPTKKALIWQQCADAIHPAMYMGDTSKSHVYLEDTSFINPTQSHGINHISKSREYDTIPVLNTTNLQYMKPYGSRTKSNSTSHEAISLDDMLAAAAYNATYLPNGANIILRADEDFIPFEKRRKYSVEEIGSEPCAYNERDGGATSYTNRLTRHHGLNTPSTHRLLTYTPSSDASADLTLREYTPTGLSEHMASNVKPWYERLQSRNSNRERRLHKQSFALRERDGRGGDYRDKIYQRTYTSEQMKPDNFQIASIRRREQEEIRQKTGYLAALFLDRKTRSRDFERFENYKDTSHREKHCVSPKSNPVSSHELSTFSDDQVTPNTTRKRRNDSGYNSLRLSPNQFRYPASCGSKNLDSSRSNNANGNSLYLTKDYSIAKGIVTNQQTSDEYRHSYVLGRDCIYKPSRRQSHFTDTPVPRNDNAYSESGPGFAATCDKSSGHSLQYDRYNNRKQCYRSNHTNPNEQQTRRSSDCYIHDRRYSRLDDESADRNRRRNSTRIVFHSDVVDDAVNIKNNNEYGYDYSYKNDSGYRSIHGQQRVESSQYRRPYESSALRRQEEYTSSPRNYGYNIASNRSSADSIYSRQVNGRGHFAAQTTSERNYRHEHVADYYNRSRFSESPRYAPNYAQEPVASPRFRHNIETQSHDKYYNGSQQFHQVERIYHHAEAAHSTPGQHSPHEHPHHHAYYKRTDYHYYQSNGKMSTQNSTRHWT